MVEYYVNDNYIDFFGKQCCAVMAKVQSRSLLVAEVNHKPNAELIAKILNDDKNGVSSVYRAWEQC